MCWSSTKQTSLSNVTCSRHHIVEQIADLSLNKNHSLTTLVQVWKWEGLWRLVVILVHTTGSTWCKVVYPHTLHVMVVYLTLCTFFVEINESSLSDAKFMIQDVVSPHCGNKRMARRCTKFPLPDYFVICIIVQNAEIYTNVGKVSTF
jgi:hypothetical protein